ncbi:MAG: ECF transporter S component [Lachnospiraceae bacterium]|nr:ECF transporter S component [Lachnospiraceae bacterium]
MVIRNKKIRDVLRILIPFLVIPLAIFIAYKAFRQQHYSVTTLVVLVLSLLLFAAGYEKKKTGSRRMVLAAVMTALAILGRFIPYIKPMTALIILSGMYLGAETGFMTGALAAAVSNFYFGQGPWTPFQMFALGMIGLTAGFFSRPLKEKKLLLLVYGGFSGIVYSLIMDIWTVLWYNEGLVFELYKAAVLSAVPYTITYCISNVVFLAVLGRPIGEKLERIHVKYGI